MNLNLSADSRSNSKNYLLYASAIVAILTFITYISSFSGDFINYDDKAYLFENPVIRQLDIPSIISMLTSSHAGWWMPLTWLSFAIDYQVWGFNPFGFHLTNTVIHAVNASVVVMIAARVVMLIAESETICLRQICFAALAGLVWSLHPLRVESVAWIAERKDVLNGFFALLSVLFYLKGKVSASGRGRRGSYSLLSLLLFYMSLGAKSVTVVLPFMLLAIDLFPLKRLNAGTFMARAAEKIPYLAGSAAVVLTTLVTAAKGDLLVSYGSFPFSQRLAVSGNAIVEYLRLSVFPVGLSPLNVIPDPIPSAYAVKAIVTLVIIVFVVMSRKAWLQSCFACFLLPFLPVLAFFQNGDQAFADHFTYLPAVAPSIAVAALLFTVTKDWGNTGKALLLFSVFGAVALLALLSIRMFPVWSSTESFWTRIIKQQPIAINYKERGRNFHLDGRYVEAAADFTMAIERLPETLKPYSFNLYAFRAESLRSAGRYAEALQDFDTAISLLPHPVYFHHRGLVLKALGRHAEAEKDFKLGGNVTYPVVWFDREL